MATSTEIAARKLFLELQPGDRLKVNHQITVGNKQWNAVTEGEVVRTERRRHGLHFRRNPDDKVYSDLIVLRRPSGELTTVTVDEYTELAKL